MTGQVVPHGRTRLDVHLPSVYLASWLPVISVWLDRHRLPLATVTIAVTLLGGAVWYRSLGAVGTDASARVGFPALSGRPTYGAAGGALQVLLFSDFGCLNCMRAEQTLVPDLLRLATKRPGVQVTLLSPALLGPDSGAASLLAGCIWQRGPQRLMKARALLFASQGPANSGWVNDRLIGRLSGVSGVSVPALRRCLSDERLAAQSRDETAAYGLAGTTVLPALFVGGHLISSSPAALERAVTYLLAHPEAPATPAPGPGSGP